MKTRLSNLPFLIWIFTLLSLFFFIMLILFRANFPAYPLISYQDAADILTPLVLIPIYWLLFKSASGGRPTRAEEIAFIVLAALWTEGQGIHLAANSIDNLISALAHSQTLDVTGTDLYRLTYFLDEHLSHYLWHIGVLGMMALLIYVEWRKPAGETTRWGSILPCGIIYGFTYFCIFLEGQTVTMSLPVTLLVLLVILIWGRAKLAKQPVVAFFFVSCLVAALFLGGWGIYWDGFPQFSDVGLI
jgi:hypothetical protein